MGKMSFNTGDFMSSDKPWDYMVSTGLCANDSTLSQQELTALHSAIYDLDDAHLALTLVIAENFAPDTFAEDAARLLGHPSLSVRVNAYRVLRAIPAHMLSQRIRDAVTLCLSECPERDIFADALSRDPES